MKVRKETTNKGVRPPYDVVMTTRKSRKAKYRRNGQSLKIHQNWQRKIQMHVGRRKMTKYIMVIRSM
jgi:hypothetical protein